jgi:hypothetical protein
LQNPDWGPADPSGDKPARPTTFDITRDEAEFRRLVRVEILGWLQGVGRWAAGGGATPPGEEEGSREREQQYRAFEAYFAERGRFRLDPEGRAAKHTHWGETGAGEWSVAQMLIDPEGLNDWEAVFTVPLAVSRAENRAVVRFETVRPVGGL